MIWALLNVCPGLQLILDRIQGFELTFKALNHLPVIRVYQCLCQEPVWKLHSFKNASLSFQELLLDIQERENLS